MECLKTSSSSVTYFLFLLSWLPVYCLRNEETNAPRDLLLRTVTRNLWFWKLEEYPEMATMDGFHVHDDKLESYAYNRFTARYNYCRQLLVQLEPVNKTSLTRADRLTYEVLTDQLQTYVAGYSWREYGTLNPINFMEGVHKTYGWVQFAKFHTKQDYAKYLTRLNLIPRQVEEVIDLLERAIQAKRTNHAVSMKGVVEGIRNLSESDPHSTPFYRPYGFRLDALPEPRNVRMHMRSEGRNVIELRIQPSLRRLKEYLVNRYIPMTREQVGIGSVEHGDEYYERVLHWHLSVNMSAQEVHDIGLGEVSRIRIEMEKLMRWLDFDGDLSDFFKHLRNKPEFFDHDEIGLLHKYQQVIYQRIQPRLPQLFSGISSLPNVTVVALSHDGIEAAYGMDTMFINTMKPHTRPDFAALTLCLHEALPGHHLQLSFAKMQPLPNFRRYTWFTKKYSAPFVFPHYTAYVEGWALYAEFLGEEMALFDRPYELFGRYTYEIFRACRLVVDTGIHTMGWSREDAVQYLSNYTFMTREQLEKEVDRYITWPGQACAYKIGELKIKELRNRAMTRLGWKYSPREFHRNVLELGPVPLHLLEEHIEHWIEQNVPSVAHSRQMSNFNFSVVLFLVFCRAALMHFSIFI